MDQQNDSQQSDLQSSSNATLTEQQPKRRWGGKKKFIPAVLLAAILLVGGGAAAFMAISSQTPEEKLYSALDNTSDALEDFAELEDTPKGVLLKGLFKVSSPQAVDGSLEGSFKDGKGLLTANAGALGVRLNAEIRTLPAENSEVPDLYAKVSGLDGAAGLLGGMGGSQLADAVAQVNDQWFVVDHTLLESRASGAEDLPELSDDDIKNIKERALEPVEDRLLSSDPDKAVFYVDQVYGEEEFEGTDTTKMSVGVNKENLIAFLESYESVVKDTKLKDLIEATSGKSVDEVVEFDKLRKNIEESEIDFDSARADVWVAGGKYIRNVRFYPVEDKRDTNYVDFMLTDVRGNTLPLLMRLTIDDDGAKGTAAFGAELQKETTDVKLTFDVDIAQDSQPIKATGELSINATDDDVDVSAPDNAKSILELMNSFTSQSSGNNSLLTNYDDSEIDL